MARGFESKSVEFQQEEMARGERPPRPGLSAAEQERQDRRRSLELTRVRAVGDLTRATAPGHRLMLAQALASLDHQLADLEPQT